MVCWKYAEQWGALSHALCSVGMTACLTALLLLPTAAAFPLLRPSSSSTPALSWSFTPVCSLHPTFSYEVRYMLKHVWFGHPLTVLVSTKHNSTC